MSGLPKGWDEICLGDIAEARMGETILAKQLTPTGVPVYSAGQENAAWGFFENPKKLLGKGTVIISARGSIGFPKVPKADQFVSTQTTISLRFPDEEIAAYVCHWLNTVDWGGLTKGGAIPMLTVGDTNQLIVPIPPLNEQRRIVAKLEELLARVEASQQRLAKIPVILKRFRQSVLAAACSGRLTADWREENIPSENATGSPNEAHRGNEEDLPEGWTTPVFDELIVELRNGVSPRPNMSPPGTPILRISAVRGGGVDLSDLRYLETGDGYLPTYALKEKDLLFTRYNGSIELLGVCGMVRLLPDNPILYPDKIMRVRVKEEKVLPEYVEIYFQTSFARERVTEKAKSSAGQNGVSGKDIKAQKLFLPPFPEQQEIVRRVEALFAVADQIETRYQKAKAHVDRLTQSILAKAFRGELVPQNENDEPASVLLERIQAELAKAEAKKPHRKAPARPICKTYPTESEPPLAKAAEPAASYGDDSIPQQILAAMQPGREYSRADLACPLKLSAALWNHGIRQLKEQGLVSQRGERRGARYIRNS